jgi:hypothetical protein
VASRENASGFLLSVLSPVWRAKLCGDLGGATKRELALEGGEAGLFSKLVALGCGESVTMDEGLEGVVELGQMADRYQVEVVQGAAEDAAMRLLTVERCGTVLGQSVGSGLVRVEKMCRELALRRFDEFARTAGFMEVGEEALGSLLDDDGLQTEAEERVYEGVVRWMKGGKRGGVRGVGLVGKVRFPFMGSEYLAELSREADPELRLAGLDGLLLDALAVRCKPRSTWGAMKLRHLGARALVARRGGCVRWEDYTQAGGGKPKVRLEAGQSVSCLTANELYICGGLSGGSIRVWSRSTLEQGRTLIGHIKAVKALLLCGGKLVSGSDDTGIKVWDVGSGRCETELTGPGPNNGVVALAAHGGKLYCGSAGTVWVWPMEGKASTWACERTLNGDNRTNCLVAWDRMVARGSSGSEISMWRTDTWQRTRTLRGHRDAVVSLVKSGPRLISSSVDGMLRAWSTETWACVQIVEVHADQYNQYCTTLALSGTTLVGLSSEAISELRVWGLETLEPLHTLRQPAAIAARSLTSYDGEVYGAVGSEVVLWGRQGCWGANLFPVAGPALGSEVP